MIMSKNHHVPPSSTVSVTHWNNPTRERTKINCDAAVGKFDSAIAMIARDWRGNLVFACSIKVNTNIPIQAEAEALRWVVSTVQAKADALRQAVSTAMNHKLINVSFESDRQVCIQGLTSSTNSVPWRVSNILQETKYLPSLVPSFSFNQVLRNANQAAHVLSCWSLSNRFFGFFDSNSAPPSVLDVIKEDAQFVSCFC